MTRTKLWKLFSLPSPSDLGMTSDTHFNSLPMREFTPDVDGYTWEDWTNKVKQDYPVRYFFSETSPSWFRRRIQRPIKDFWYWLTCHIVPSRQYHWLDLRQPKDKDDPLAYRYGWIEPDFQMLYALFNILNNYVEHQVKHSYCPSEEDVQNDPHLLDQRNKQLEVKAIHYWWNVERKRQDQANEDLLSRWHEAKKNNDPAHHQLWNDLQKSDQDKIEKMDEMIDRLMRIRRSLWT